MLGPITLGQVAGMIAALGFLVLVYFSIKPLQKLCKVLDRLTQSLTELTEHTLPAIDEAVKTVAQANQQVQKLDVITEAAARTSEDISAMTTLITSTVGAPFLAARRGAEKVRDSFQKFTGSMQSEAEINGHDDLAAPSDSSAPSAETE